MLLAANHTVVVCNDSRSLVNNQEFRHTNTINQLTAAPSPSFLLDNGASTTCIRHSHVPYLPLTHITSSTPTTTLTYPNGTKVDSIAHAELQLAHITIPVGIFNDADLSESLLAAIPLADGGCKLTQDRAGGTIEYQNTSLALVHKHDGDFWRVPFNQFDDSKSSSSFHSPITLPLYLHTSTHYSSAIVHSTLPAQTYMGLTPALKSVQERVAWAHASLGYPSTSTFISAVSKGFISFPHITATDIRRYPPHSRFTDIGHMRQQRKNFRPLIHPPPLSNKPMSLAETVPVDDPIALSEFLKDKAYSFIISTDELLSGDATGAFPIESFDGYKYLLVLSFQNIHTLIPFKSREGVEYVRSYGEGIAEYKDHGMEAPVWIRLDNETSANLEALFVKARLGVQYVPANLHRGNKAERSVQTVKCQIISTIAGKAKSYPMKAWNHLIPHVQLCLRILFPWSIDPSKSAYEGFTGKPFDFAAHPIGPAACEVMAFVPKELRKFTSSPSSAKSSTFGDHAVPAWYLGPRLDGLRMHTVLAKESMKTRISAQLEYHPDTISLPLPPLEALLSSKTEFLSLLKREQDPSVILSTIISLQEELSHISPPLAPSQPDVPLDPVDSISSTLSTASVSIDTSSSVPVLSESPTSKGALAASKGALKTSKGALVSSKGAIKVSKDDVDISFVPALSPPALSANPNPIQALDLLEDVLNGKDLSKEELVIWHLYLARSQSTAQERRDALAFSASLGKVPPPRLSPIFSESSAQIPQHKKKPIILNLDERGRPLSLASALAGPHGSIWEKSSSNELERFLDMKCMHPIYARNLPANYQGLCTYYNPKTKEKEKEGEEPDGIQRRVRGAMGGDRIKSSGFNSCPVAEIDVVKTMLNVFISEAVSKPHTRLWTADISNFYLHTPLPTPVYMRVPIKHMSSDLLDKYDLRNHIEKDYIWFCVTKAIFGHPDAGLLSKRRIDAHMLKWGYSEDPLVACLYTHISNGTQFSLVVDDFLIKTESDAAVKHFKDCMADGGYPMVFNENPKQIKYIGITIDIDILNSKISLSMPGYIEKMQARWPHRGHVPVSTPMPYSTPIYGKSMQPPTPIDLSSPLSSEAAHEHQQIIGAIQYIARIVDLEALPAVCDLASEQSFKLSSLTSKVDQLLAYMFANPSPVLVYYASDMVLQGYSDGSYLSVSKARSRAGGCGCFGWEGSERLNGMVYAKSTILDVIVSSAAECEYAALYLLGRDMVWLREIARALGYPQKATPLKTDNKCADGLANGTAKLSKSKAMDMRFHWIRDRVKQGHFEVSWIAGEENIADFFTKALPPSVFMRLVLRLTGHLPFCGNRSATRYNKEVNLQASGHYISVR